MILFAVLLRGGCAITDDAPTFRRGVFFLKFTKSLLSAEIFYDKIPAERGERVWRKLC